MSTAQPKINLTTTEPSGGVALLLPSLEIGGTERVTITLANEFARSGIPTRVICGRAVGPLLADLSPHVALVSLDAARFRYALAPLVRELREDPPATLLSMLTQSNLLALTAIRATRSSVRLVLSERSSVAGTRRTPEARWQRLVSPFLGMAYRGAEAVVVPTDILAEELIDIGVPPSMVHVIPNPVDLENVRRSADRPADHPWFDDPEVPVVIAVGRLSPSKDITTLVRAFAILRRQLDARLVIIGEGPERQSIEACVLAEGVSTDTALLGAVNNPYPYMARSAVLASSSVVEGFPNVLVEGLALGVPVVATDCPTGPSEILDGGEFGELVAPRDPIRLAEGLTRAIRSSVNKGQLQRRAESWASSSIAAKYLEVVAPWKTGTGRSTDG